ncbi:MAG: Clp protease N-terminal domain-containing protein, partial [Patescibacteria group bacterium]
MQEIINKFTTHLKNVLTRALTFVVENNLQAVEPEHLLWALTTQKGCIGAELLAKAYVKPEDVRSLIDHHS